VSGLDGTPEWEDKPVPSDEALTEDEESKKEVMPPGEELVDQEAKKDGAG
jgi:hypothetical protein